MVQGCLKGTKRYRMRTSRERAARQEWERAAPGAVGALLIRDVISPVAVQDTSWPADQQPVRADEWRKDGMHPDKPVHGLTAADVMVPVPVLIPHRMSMRAAARLLSRLRSREAVVVDGSGRCVGVLT